MEYKGYLSSALQHQLQQVGIQLETALCSNMQDNRAPDWVKLLQRMPRLSETVIGQLVERFHIEQVWAPDLWHLTSRINPNLLADTVCLWLNLRSLEPLQLETLVAA